MLSLRVVPITLAVACLSACNGPSTVSLADYRPIDLTYTFDEKTIYWPTGKHFEHERVSWGPAEGGYWYSSYNLAGSTAARISTRRFILRRANEGFPTSPFRNSSCRP